jgi:hypothetical protein
MPDLSVLGGSILVLVVLAFLLWFVFGTQRNVGKGNEYLRWLQGGLPTIGRRTTLRWLGSTAVILGIVEPREPFREAQIVVVMEPRDVSFLWAWARARRRRDFLILRARLRASPGFELEAGNRSGWTGQDRLKRLDPGLWIEADWGDPEIRVAHTTGADVESMRRAWDELASSSGGVWRLSVRREPPHLEAHVLPPTDESAADRLLGAFRRLARSVQAA